MREYMAERYFRRRAAAIESLGGACVRCGSTDDLQFDHIDASAKLFDVGKAFAGMAQAKLDAEVAKCQLLCDLHHKEKTRECGDSAGGHNYVHDPQHGTQVMYGREGCRCDACREWRSLYRRKLVDARGVPVIPGW
jgi:hypothetical protein